MYKVEEIAEYIIQNNIISNLKLQKILYFIQANFLILKNKKCFEENIESCDFGVIIPKVYNKYRVFGASSIPNFNICKSFNIKKKDKKLINLIVNKCSSYSNGQLLDIIIQQTPWENAYKNKTYIDVKDIMQFFS